MIPLAVVCFSTGAEALAAARAIESVRRLGWVVRAIMHYDPDYLAATPPPGVLAMRGRTRGRRNLRGREWLVEQWQVLAAAGQGLSGVVKIDSDTTLESVELVAALGFADLAGVASREDGGGQLLGACYAVRPAAAVAILEELQSGRGGRLPVTEDAASWKVATRMGLRVRLEGRRCGWWKTTGRGRLG
jgi:hypothetical protein